jgi:chromate reductase, NAD(P)H dehydrogenase (quinone)
MDDLIHVLGISGSLRKGSFNTALLHAAIELAPEGMEIEIFDLAPIPLYNADIQAQGDPAAVHLFKQKIASASALLIATPEYNYSIPGVLKNAIDWASRPAKESPLNGKPLAMMGAGGRMGTVRAQLHLRQVALFTNMLPLNRPEVLVQFADQKFDFNGRLLDEVTRQSITDLLVALLAWTRRLHGS